MLKKNAVILHRPSTNCHRKTHVRTCTVIFTWPSHRQRVREQNNNDSQSPRAPPFSWQQQEEISQSAKSGPNLLVQGRVNRSQRWLLYYDTPQRPGHLQMIWQLHDYGVKISFWSPPRTHRSSSSWPLPVALLPEPPESRGMENIVTHSGGILTEAFSRNPSDGGFASLAYQPST